MPRKTFRNFLVDFATLDIEYLPRKGPKVSDDIQMVYIMGDVTPAAAQAVATQYAGANASTANVAGEHSIASIEVIPANGIIVDGLQLNRNSSPTFQDSQFAWTSVVAPTIVGAAVIVPALSSGFTPAAIFTAGTILTAGIPAASFVIRPPNQHWSNWQPMFVRQGMFFNFAYGSSGQACQISVRWQEPT